MYFPEITNHEHSEGIASDPLEDARLLVFKKENRPDNRDGVVRSQQFYYV